jgi:hypothetical protein
MTKEIVIQKEYRFIMVEEYKDGEWRAGIAIPAKFAKRVAKAIIKAEELGEITSVVIKKAK